MKVSIVVAAAENGTIGSDGSIPWRLPDDQRLFKYLTFGHCIVMGRVTFESIGRLLPGRTTLVVSTNPDYGVEGAHVVNGLSAALELARNTGEDEVFVVGGEGLYALALPLADVIHLTRIHADIPGDTRFPGPAELEHSGYTRVETERHAEDERHAYAFSFERWERTRASS